jgi:hypothetical protein
MKTENTTDNESVIYVSATTDPISVILGILAGIALLSANFFIYTMPVSDDNSWIKTVIGILFNFLWIANFYRWIVDPLKSTE